MCNIIKIRGQGLQNVFSRPKTSARTPSLILTYGHGYLVMTEKVRSEVCTSEMRFLRRFEGVTLFNMVRCSEIRKSLNIERYFSELKDLNFRKGFLKKLYLPKQMRENELDDLEV